MKRLVTYILNNIPAKIAEVFKTLNGRVDLCRVDFKIFVNKKISQIYHRGDFLSKIYRDDAVISKRQYCLPVVIRPGQIIVGDDIMGDIKEALNG